VHKVELLTDRPERAGVSEILGAALITLAQIPLAFVFTVILDVIALKGGACGEHNCNEAVGYASTVIPMFVGAVSLALSVVLIVVWAIRGGSLWRAPVTGLGLITASFIVAVIIINVSLTPSG
jgi:hypothetical protein